MNVIEIMDERLHPVVAHPPALERLCTGAIWSEGPVWIAEGDSVLWSDIPNNRMLRWSARHGMSVWRERVEFTKGHARDRDGSLLHCSHGLRAVFRTDVDGSNQRIVVDRWQGKRFNAPNDVVVKSDGTIWFTDPPYGLIIPEPTKHRSKRVLRREAIAVPSHSFLEAPVPPGLLPILGP